MGFTLSRLTYAGLNDFILFPIYFSRVHLKLSLGPTKIWYIVNFLQISLA